MIWYIIHNILKTVSPTMEPQHRNLTTFLTGVVLYTLFYSYVGTLGREHTFLNVFFKYSVYILMADAFAMAILYKNFYKHTIFREVEETMGASGPKQTATNVEPIVTVEAQIDTPSQERLPELLDEGDCNDDNSMEGFAKDSALGERFNTNGKSND